RRAPLEEGVPAVGKLLPLEVTHRARLALAIHTVDEMAQKQVLGGDRRVGFELADPVAIGGLLAKQMRLGAADRVLQVPHVGDGNMLTGLGKPLEWTFSSEPWCFDPTFLPSWRSSWARGRSIWAGGAPSASPAASGRWPGSPSSRPPALESPSGSIRTRSSRAAASCSWPTCP